MRCRIQVPISSTSWRHSNGQRKQEEERAKDTVQTRPCWPTHLIVTEKGSIWHVKENVTKTKDAIFSDPTVLIFCFDFRYKNFRFVGVWHYHIAGFPCHVEHTHIYHIRSYSLGFSYTWLVFSQTEYDFLYWVTVKQAKVMLDLYSESDCKI